MSDHQSNEDPIERAYRLEQQGVQVDWDAAARDAERLKRSLAIQGRQDTLVSLGGQIRYFEACSGGKGSALSPNACAEMANLLRDARHMAAECERLRALIRDHGRHHYACHEYMWLTGAKGMSDEHPERPPCNCWLALAAEGGSA